jgi:hypothetical protein
MKPLTSERIAARCRDDGEFRLAARYWDGSLAIDLGDALIEFALHEGRIEAGRGGSPALAIRAPAETWEALMAPVPPPFLNDMVPARAFGLEIDGPEETFWQYYPAIRRLVDLMREEWS